jgi:glycosyltransferase involved in cell wall biosynthesis
VRIALVSDWWAPRIGGIESQLTDLAAELARRGHRVRVLTTTSDPTKVAGVSVEHVAMPLLGAIPVPGTRRIGEIARLLDAERPEVVHAHGMFSPLAIAAVVAADRIGVPRVATVHSLLAPWPVYMAACAIFSAFTNRANLFTAVSRAVAADVQRASSRSVIVVPNGLDVDAWRVERAVAANEVRVVAVLRLVPKKRPRDLIEAFDVACRANPGLNLRLTLVGDGPMRGSLERDAARRGVASRVTFAGGCSRDAVRALLAQASIVAHPGGREAFGLALLEARSAGVPIVAMAAGGVAEIVEHGRTGLLATTRDEFGRHLATLARDAELRGRMASATRDGLADFTWTAVGSRYEEVYKLAGSPSMAS